MDLISQMSIFPPEGESGVERSVHKHIFIKAQLRCVLVSGRITTATKRQTQMTFKISFPQMTHDSLSAVKIQTDPLWMASCSTAGK